MLAGAKTGVAWTSRRAVRTVREEGTEKKKRDEEEDKEDENYDEEKRA